MKSEDVPGKHIRVLRITFLLDEILHYDDKKWRGIFKLFFHKTISIACVNDTECRR